MKLNPDCIRDLLFEVEENTQIDRCYRYDNETIDPDSRLAKYTKDEVLYHANQCEMNGLLIGVSMTNDYHCYINDLTPAGHAFLADIRADTVWNKTKETAKDVGSFSLHALKEIATNIITNLITGHFSGT